MHFYIVPIVIDQNNKIHLVSLDTKQEENKNYKSRMGQFYIFFSYNKWRKIFTNKNVMKKVIRGDDILSIQDIQKNESIKNIIENDQYSAYMINHELLDQLIETMSDSFKKYNILSLVFSICHNIATTEILKGHIDTSKFDNEEKMQVSIEVTKPIRFINNLLILESLIRKEIKIKISLFSILESYTDNVEKVNRGVDSRLLLCERDSCFSSNDYKSASDNKI